MAISHPLILDQSVFVAKAETTNGTAITVTASDGAFNIFDSQVQPNINMIRRMGQQSSSQLPSVAGARGGSCSFGCELVGNGGSGLPAWASTFLPAAGFVASGSTYAPVTGGSSQQTLTVAKYTDGVKRFLAGTSLDFSMRFVTGNPVMLDFTGVGIYQTEADATLLAPTYPTTKPPVFIGGTLTVGGTAYQVSNLTIAINNTLYLRPDANSTFGYKSSVITHRDITVSFDPESSLVATKDWYGAWVASTEAALSIVVGSDSNNTMTISAPKLQLTNKQAGDREGVMTEQITAQCNRSASAGDDELTIAFS